MKEFWDQRYAEEGFAYGTRPNDFLVSVADRLCGDVLCIAEGEGRNALFLAKRGLNVTAVDQSEVGLEKAAVLANEHGVSIETVEADLADFEIAPGSWDGVVSISAHLPPAIRKPLHRKIVEGLKPGAVLVLEAYTVKHIDMPGIGGPPPEQRQMFMALVELEKELAGLDFIHACETDREFDEGKYHRGLSSVVQLLACKPTPG